MKKILQFGLFTLLGGAFVDANASDVPQSGMAEPTSSLSVVPQSLSQLAEISPEVAAILKDIDQITEIWGKRSLSSEEWQITELWDKRSLSSEEVQTFRGFVHSIQALPESQVLELAKLSNLGSKDLQELFAIDYQYESPAYWRKISRIRRLAGLVKPISLLSKLMEAYKTLSVLDDSDKKEARDTFFKFARSVKGRDCKEVLKGMRYVLSIMHSGSEKYTSENDPLDALVKVICGLYSSYVDSAEPSLWSLKQNGSNVSGVGIDRLPSGQFGGIELDNAPSRPFQVRFYGDIDWDVNSSDAMKIIRILSNVGLVQYVSIQNTNGNFPIPEMVNDHVKFVALNNVTISGHITDFLLKFHDLTVLHIMYERGVSDKFIKFLEDAPYNINRIDCFTEDENSKLLRYIWKSKYKNSLETLTFSPGFLLCNRDLIEKIKTDIEDLPKTFEGMDFKLDLAKDGEDLLEAFRIWNTIVASPKVEGGCLTVSSNELDKLHKIEEFRTLLSQSNINSLMYYPIKGKSSNSLIEIIPFLPVGLEKIRFGHKWIYNAITDNEAKILFSKILEYCNNVRIPSEWSELGYMDMTSIVLHPFIDADTINAFAIEFSFIAEAANVYDELNDQERAGKIIKYSKMVDELISNNRVLREQCTRIMTEVWRKKRCAKIKPLNDKMAEYVAFLANQYVPQLRQKFHAILSNQYALQSNQCVRQKFHTIYENFYHSDLYYGGRQKIYEAYVNRYKEHVKTYREFIDECRYVLEWAKTYTEWNESEKKKPSNETADSLPMLETPRQVVSPQVPLPNFAPIFDPYLGRAPLPLCSSNGNNCGHAPSNPPKFPPILEAHGCSMRHQLLACSLNGGHGTMKLSPLNEEIAKYGLSLLAEIANVAGIPMPVPPAAPAPELQPEEKLEIRRKFLERAEEFEAKFSTFEEMLRTFEGIPQSELKLAAIHEYGRIQQQRQESQLAICREFLKWIEDFDAQQRAFTDSIIKLLKDLIAEDPNASLTEQLKSLEESVKAQRSWCLKLRQEVCQLMFQIVQYSEGDLYEIASGITGISQEPDHERVKEDK